MSLRNISLENCSYEMMKTQYHDLFITTRTSIQDPSIRPPGGNRSNTFYILEQGEYEGEEGFWVKNEEGLEGFMSTNDEDTFWVLEENDAFIARKVSGRNFRFKKRKGKGKSTSKKGSHQRGGFKPFRKGSSGGKANMANEYQDPYDQAYWGKGKGKKGKKGKSKFQYPYDGNKGYPSYDNGKGKGGQKKGESKTFAAIAEKTEEQGLWATKLMAPVTNPQRNPTSAILDNRCTRSMGSWHAIQRFTQAVEPMKDLIFHFCKWRDSPPQVLYDTSMQHP